jgi:hypothetical protein
MLVGVIGHKGYDELPEMLRMLHRSAPALGVELRFEPDLYQLAQVGERLDDLSGIDALVT